MVAPAIIILKAKDHISKFLFEGLNIMKPNGYVSISPILFFILWESGAVHSALGLITPLYIVNAVSALCLSTFAMLTDMEKSFKIFFALLLFFLPIFILTVTPYLFIILVFAYLLSRNTVILKGTIILLPLTLTESLGLTLPLWFIVSITFLLFIFRPGLKNALRPKTKLLTYYILTSVLLIFLLISFSPNDPFASLKNNTVAYDGYHSEVKGLYFKNDTTVYPTLRYLESIGYTSSIINEPISADTLRGTSVFIIDTPSKNFSSTEIEQLVNFVEEGGGLFILGDHTNVVNCYITLNPLLNRFSIRLNFDYSMLQEPHFSSLAAIDSFEETGGGTLSIGAWDGMIFYTLKYTSWADQGNWGASDNAFIGNLKPEENEEYGVLPICATVNHGFGRVVVISNSDSIQSPLLPYNHKFLAKVIDYLNHENSLIRASYFRIFLLAFILFCIIKLRSSFIIIFLISLLFTLLVLQIYAIIPVKSLPEVNSIALDVGHANVERYAPPDLYRNMFFVIFAQHYDLNPVLVENVPRNLEIYKAYVTMGPTMPFSAEEIDRIKVYVENGGALIIFDGYHAETPTRTSNDAGNSLLKTFGMSFSGQLLGETSYGGSTTWNYQMASQTEATIEAEPMTSELMGNVNGSITMYSATEVQGGTSIATYKDQPVIALKSIDRGYVLVIGDHTVLKNIAEYQPVFRFVDLNLTQFIGNIFTFLGGKEQFGV